MKKVKISQDTVKTIAIALLFAITLIMVYMHFNIVKVKSHNSSDVSYLKNKLYLESGDSSDFSVLSENALLPSTVAVKNSDGDLYSISSGSEFMHDVYSLISSDIAIALSDRCTVSLSAEEGIFDAATEKNELIYVKYHNRFPALFIAYEAMSSALNTGSLSPSLDAGSIYLSEMIIFPKNKGNDEPFAMTRDILGSVYCYFLNEKADYSATRINDFDIYISASAMLPAEFYGIDNGDSVLSTTVIYSAPLSQYTLRITKGYTKMKSNTEIQKEISNLFNINTDKTGSYYDKEIDGTVYLSTHGELSFASDVIHYSTESNANGGIPLSFYTGKDTDNQHTFYECLAVAHGLAQKLSSALITHSNMSNEADILINDVYRKGDKLIISFGYFYDNIPIECLENSISLELTGAKLTDIKITPANIVCDKSEQVKSINSRWTIEIAKEFATDKNAFSTVYKYTAKAGNEYSAEWIPVSAAN